MNNLDYQIKVLLDLKTGTTHKDATLPRISLKANAQGQKGEFFVVSLMPLSKGPKFVFGKAVKFTIWNTGQRAEIFNRLKNLLLTPADVTVDADKNAILSDTAGFFAGSLRKEDCGFFYTMTDSDGKPLVDSKGIPQTRNYVQVFVFDFEQDNGTADIIIANEVNRAKKTEVMNAE
jgi:hypothetical protein